MPSFERDRECSAAPGVCGWLACQHYPGCGCGGTSYEDPVPQPTKSEYESKYTYTPISEWRSIYFENPRKVPVGCGLEVTISGKTFLLNKPLRFKIVGKQNVVFLTKELEQYSAIKDIFIPV